MGERWLTVVVEPEPTAPATRRSPFPDPTRERRPVTVVPPVRASRRRALWPLAAGALLLGGLITASAGAWLMAASSARWEVIAGESAEAGRELGGRFQTAAGALADDLAGLDSTASTLGEVSASLDAALRAAADLEAAANGGLVFGPEGVETLIGGIGRLADAIDAAFPALAEIGVTGTEGPGSALRAATRALIDLYDGPAPDPVTGFGPFVLRYPLPGYPVTGPFGTPQGDGFHGGVDMAAPAGTPILAADDGVVLQAGWLDEAAGFGVILGHRQGWETRYFHMRSADLPVAAGDTVTAGQVIGYVGSTGLSTGPHLHFEIVYGPVRLDPQSGFTYLGTDTAAVPRSDPPGDAASGSGAPGSRPADRTPAEPGHTALPDAPAQIAEARRQLAVIGTDALAWASQTDARRAEEQARSRNASLVFSAGTLVMMIGAATWWVRGRRRALRPGEPARA